LGGESLSPSAGIVFARWSSGVRIWTPAPTQESTWVGLGERDRGRGGRFRAGLGNGTCPQSAGGGLPPRPGPAAGPAALLSCRFCFLRRLRVGSEEDVSWFWGSQPSPAAIFLSDGPSARDTSRPGCKAHGQLRFGKKARSWWPTHGASCQSALAGRSVCRRRCGGSQGFDAPRLTSGGGGCRSAATAMLEPGECYC
jgi:hypothetical protein